MNRLRARLRPLLLTARTLAPAIAFSVVHHWMLALFSLVAAFAIWFFVQDVENPRIEVVVPAEDQPPIAVEVVNVPNGLIVGEVAPVRVLVEARAEEIDEIRAADFNAVVDASGIGDGDVRSLPVTVTTQRSDVSVVRAEPGTVEVSAVATFSLELRVTVNFTGELPSGFRKRLHTVDPPFVTISGREELVRSVDEVQATVSLSELQSTDTFDAELVPRTSDGSRVTVTLSRLRARVTVPVEEALLTRQIPVRGGVAGRPARGYAVTDVSVSPSPIEVTGPREIVESLTAFVVEDVVVGGASDEVIASRDLELPEGVTAADETVFITVTIEPQEGSRVLRVETRFVDIPEGLEPAPNVFYFVEVTLSGLEPDLARLSPGDVDVVISLDNAQLGSSLYVARVSPIPGINVESVAPLWVELVEAAPAPAEDADADEDEEAEDGQ